MVDGRWWMVGGIQRNITWERKMWGWTWFVLVARSFWSLGGRLGQSTEGRVGFATGIYISVVVRLEMKKAWLTLYYHRSNPSPPPLLSLCLFCLCRPGVWCWVFGVVFVFCSLASSTAFLRFLPSSFFLCSSVPSFARFEIGQHNTTQHTISA
jgi:hypothetical protein